MSWREEKKDQLRERIFQTAIQSFKSKGYEETKIIDITRQVGIAKGTFFNYFPSKDHVLADWYRNCDLMAFESIQDTEFASGTEAILELIRANVEFTLKDKSLLLAKHRHSFGLEPLSEEEEKGDVVFFKFCLEHIQKDQTAGILDSALDSEHIADLVITLLTGIARRWVYQNANFDLAEKVQNDLTFLFQRMAK